MEAISQIIAMVQRLIEKDHAYVTGGDVYFFVSSDDDYGKLSGRRLEDMQSGFRIGVDERKENPLDFALWKAAKNDDKVWFVILLLVHTMGILDILYIFVFSKMKFKKTKNKK